MGSFIAGMIIKKANESIVDGQAKYISYFVSTKLYEKWKPEVDEVLREAGYDSCIVSK